MGICQKKKKTNIEAIEKMGRFRYPKCKVLQNFCIDNAELGEREERDSDNQFGTPFQITITLTVFFTHTHTQH